MNRKILFKAKRKDNGEWVERVLPERTKNKPFYMHRKNKTALQHLKCMRLTLLPSANTRDLPIRTVRRFGKMIFVKWYMTEQYIYMLLFGIKQNLILNEQMEKKTMDVILSISDAVKKLL